MSDNRPPRRDSGSANRILEARPPRGLGSKVSGLEGRVEDHEYRITQIESERPPAHVEPMLPPRPRPAPARGPSPSSRNIHVAIPTPARDMQIDAVRRQSEADLEKERTLAAFIVYAQSQERRSARLEAELAAERVAREEHAARVEEQLAHQRRVDAVIVRELGVEELLPDDVRKSLPPPADGTAQKAAAPQPLQATLRQVGKRGRNGMVALVFLEVLLELARRGVFDTLGKVLLP